MPEITPIIWRTMGNQRKACETLRFSDDPQVASFLSVYLRMNKDDQDHLPLEIVCFAAQVPPPYILGQLILTARNVTRAESALMLMTKQTDVLEATARWGITSYENSKDREMILKAAGILPSPQGSSVNVNVFGAKSTQEEEQGPRESQLESDVFGYDSHEVESWGHDRRQVLEGE